MKPFFYILIKLFCFNLFLQGQNNHTQLNLKWQFRQKGTWNWNIKNVIGNVHLDLLANGIIKEPVYADNEKNLQWIENEDWEYKSEFDVAPEIVRQTHVELTFAGLDTYATVYLNDSLLFKADNMFREWKADAKPLLREKGNTIRIIFESPVKKAKKLLATMPYALPEWERSLTRKAQYHYGWDWGPRFVTAGIWKPIYLKAWTDFELKNVHYVITQLDSSIAKLNIIYETVCETPGTYQAECAYVLQKSVLSANWEKTYKTLKLKQGQNFDTLECIIRHPKWWWCNGMGEPSLYAFRCSVSDNGNQQQIKRFNAGLRKLELVQESDPAGSSFYFKLNHVPVFIKGANYIPTSSFLFHDYGEQRNSYPAIAKKLHMNMLRVWGGGVYESDSFYDECDKNGILVWQDLMFACAMYPGNKEFVQNVEQEVKEQCLRLRNHPSLALWCGNNEVDEGWKNWGWQKQFQYNAKDSATIYNDYLNLFQNKIPTVISQNHPQTIYWPSSPLIGWGHKESLTSGDAHYWGVWWGMDPFSVYRQKVGRFMSEYGFQGLPNLSTFKKFCPPNELNLNSQVLRSHQKHGKGFETINAYMSRDYKIPNNFHHYIYTSQLLQRDGMQMAIEAHRSSKMYCMGTLFWQLNDCWPSISWSAIDNEGSKKAFYYSLNKLYGTFLISTIEQKSLIKVSCISDSLPDLKADLKIKLMDFYGKIIWQQTYSINLSSTLVRTQFIERSKLPAFDTSAVFLHCELLHNNKKLAENNFFFTSPKNLKLPLANLLITSTGAGIIKVKSNTFAKDVFIYSDQKDMNFDNNYYDLMPGETKTIKTSDKTSVNTTQLKNITLNTIK